MANAVTGVEKIEIAPIATGEDIGTMPSTGWVTFQDIQEGSVTFTVPEVQVTNIRVEDKSGVRHVLPGETDPPEFSAASIWIDGAIVEMLFGGTWTSGTKTYAAPTTDVITQLAIRFTSKAYGGEKFVLEIPVASIVPGFDGSFTRDNMLAVSFTGRATTPVDSNGDALSPWGFKFEAVA